MRFNRCMILLQPAKETLIPFNLLREVLQQPVFQPVLLALVIRLHQAKAGYIHIQVHLFLDGRITGAERLDLRIGQGGFVNILTGAYRTFAGHDLGDEFLLVLHRLPEIGVKGALGNIAVNLYIRILIALPDNASRTLLQITRTPRTVEIMQRDQSIL